MSNESGKFLNNKYAVVFGILGGYYLTKDYNNTLLTIIACIICVIVLSIIFNRFLYQYDMEIVFINISFNPNIWGTVSDWTIILITAITAYFLYKTLKSQKDVQKTQNELYNIENARFIESIKPILKFSESKEKHTIIEDYYDIISIEIQNISGNIAKNIDIVFENNDNVKRIIIPKNYLTNSLKDITNLDESYFLHILIIKKPIAVEFIKFEVKYQDYTNRKYKQNVVCIYEENSISIINKQPELE